MNASTLVTTFMPTLHKLISTFQEYLSHSAHFAIIPISTCTESASTHLSKLSGNEKLNFFGEPSYVLPKS